MTAVPLFFYSPILVVPSLRLIQTALDNTIDFFAGAFSEITTAQVIGVLAVVWSYYALRPFWDWGLAFIYFSLTTVEGLIHTLAQKIRPQHIWLTVIHHN